MTQFRWAGVPLVSKDVVVIGAPGLDFPTRKEGTPGDVRAYDVRTGKLRWTFHVIPRSGEFGVNTWEDDSRRRPPIHRSRHRLGNTRR